MNFAIYSRKSKYTGRGESIENQIDYCTQYIKLSFKEVEPINIHIYSDEGYSGKNLDRPSFKTMLKDCYSHMIDYVVVYRLDRISRNVSDFANMYQELINLNIGFISTSEKYDTSTSGGRAMLFMACVFAQLERETISERVKDNMYSLAKSGRWLGGISPTGYSSVVCSKNGGNRHILISNDNLKIVELIYNKYLESFNISAVEEYLYNSNILSPSGNYYSKSSIKTLLENPVYCKSDNISLEYLKELGCTISCSPEQCNGNGYIVYGRTSTQGGRFQKRVSANNWIVSIGEHMGVVSGYNWVAIQRHLHRENYRNSIVHNSNSLLSGKIFCPICNSKMIPRTRKSGFSYTCSNKLKYGTKVCNSKNVDGSLDTLILSQIFNTVKPSPDIIPLLENLKKSTNKSYINIQDSINLDSNKTIIENFNNLPIHIRRNFLDEIICNIQII